MLLDWREGEEERNNGGGGAEKGLKWGDLGVGRGWVRRG